MTLTSDLVSRIILSGAYLLNHDEGIPNLVYGCILGGGEVRIPNLVYGNILGVTVTLALFTLET